MPRGACLSVAVLAAAFHLGVHAQETSTSGSPTQASETERRAIRLEAIVTDKQGKPVVNLRPADFVLLENGIAQKIESAVLMSRAAAAPASPIASHADAERAAKEPGTRTIAIYLDEFHVNPGEGTDRVRQAVSRFVDEQVRPADLLVVMKPLDSVTDIRFTRDREAIRKAIVSFEGRKDDYTPRTAFEQQYMGRSPEAVRSARAQIVISGLRALTTRMGELEGGLGALVLVTEGFNAEVPRSREHRLPDLQGIVRAASRSGLLLYTFDPGPLPAGDRDASGEVMQTLARQTGGDAVAAGGDLLAGLQRLSRDLDTYYVLTYRSSLANDGRFHDIQVTSTRRGALVRTRSGYWAPLPFELRAARRTAPPPLVPMRAVRRSLLIDSWVGTTITTDGRRQVIFTWSPTPVSPTARKVVRPEVVALKVSTTSGQVLFEGEVSPVRPGAPGTPHPASAVFDAPATGRLQLDFTIQAADGSKLDTGAQDFDLPEVRGGPPIILPPQLFRAASAREFREISADPYAAPLPDRQFRRTDHLVMRVPTIDPAGERVQVAVKLINRVGATVSEVGPSDQSPTNSTQFDLPLARFAPGEYSFEISAQSASGIARQLIRFRITG